MADPAPPSSDALLQHAAFVRSVARAALQGDDLVDDVVQETWVAALEGGARAKRLRPWLGGVARRQAHNLLRRRIASRERDRRVARPEVGMPTSDVAERAETGRALVGAVLALEEPYRTAVLLRYYDDLPPREVANRTGVPVETARTHVKRGLARLRQRLDEDASRRDRSAPALLLPLLEGEPSPATFPLLAGLGGLLAVKKLVLVPGIVVLLLLGGYAIWSGVPKRGAPPPSPPVGVAEAPAPPRLEGAPAKADEQGASVDGADAPRGGRRSDVSTFDGVVVDPDGKPIPGVTIDIDRNPPSNALRQGKPPVDPDTVEPATSDAEGHFRLEVAGKVGWLYARARAPGWVTTAEWGTGLSSQAETRVVMAPACPLDVTVLDDRTGRPIASAEIHGLVGGMARAYLVHTPWPVTVARTDGDGRARLQLPEGRVRLLVFAAAYAVFQEDGVGLRPVGGSITLRLRPGGTVHGVVVDADGAPVPDAVVHAFAPAAWQAEIRTDGQGAFRLEGTTPPLAEDLSVKALTHVVVKVTKDGRPRAWGAIPAPASGEEAAIRVVLEEPRHLRGGVRMADGTEPPPGSVSLTVMDLGTRAHYASTPTMHASLDDTGHFSFGPLPAGEVELVLYRGTPLETKVSSEIPRDGDPAPLEVVLGDGLDLSVRVVDASGAPVAGARVHSLRKDAEIDWNPTLDGHGRITDDEGRLVLEDLAPVPTYVVVDAVGFGLELHFLELTEGAPELVVRLGDGTIEGRAVHPDGRPAHVSLRLTRSIRLERYSTSIPSRTTRVETDAGGYFRFERVGEGPYGIHVDRNELRLLSFGVVLHAGDTDARIIAATEHEASKLHVEALFVDAETLAPIEEDLQVMIHPEGGRGSGMMARLSEPPGVYRSTEPYAPGTHTVRVQGKGWGSAEAVVRLTWGEDTPRPRVLLSRAE